MVDFSMNSMLSDMKSLSEVGKSKKDSTLTTG